MRARRSVFGDCSDGPEEKSLKTLAKQPGVWEVVDFVGQVEPSGFPFICGAPISLWRPSRSEGLGNSFLEAMATDCPS